MQYQDCFDNIYVSEDFKNRMVIMMEKMNGYIDKPVLTKKHTRIPLRRKVLLIAIAAILLALSACTAYAIYWSSIQRAKEYMDSPQEIDNHQEMAGKHADAIIAGMTFYGAINGKAEVDGVALALKSASYWLNGDPPELHLAFNATDAKANGIERLYDFDFALTVNGKSYPAYAKADGTARALPIIAQADAMAEGAEYEMWFRMDDGQAVTDGTPMTLAGELYAYDENNQRGDSLGSFSLDFTYTVPHAQIAAERERLIAEALNGLDADAQAQAETLSGLPDETTPLGVTQDEYTFTDALVTAEGFVLGQTIMTYGADSAKLYMDGYRCYGETISSIFTPDTTRPRQDVAWEVAYYGTREEVKRYPWYAPVEELPETVLIALLRDAETKQRRKAGLNGYEEDMLTYTWGAVELLLRVNPHTGEITLPKDDAERTAWKKEVERLSMDGRNEPSYCLLDDSQRIGDISLKLERLGFNPELRELYISYQIDGLYCPPESSSLVPRIFLDGIELESWYKGGPYTASLAEEWVESNGALAKINDWKSNTSGHSILVAPQSLPSSFSMRFVWDVYDRDAAYNRVFIGTFDITFQVNKSDIQIGEAVL